MSVKRFDVMSYSLDVDGNSGPFVKYEDYAALEARCAALAAENAGLKAEHELALQYMDELRANFTMYKKFKCQSQSDVTTPATDAFLAEVRARALPVEIAEIIDSGDLEAILFATEYPEAERYRMALYNFRTSRKGVQS